MNLTELFRDFIRSERTGGIVLIICTIVSLIAANSVFGEDYRHIWHAHVGDYSLEFWINDGLMTIFFLLVGLEIEREFYIGELSGVKKALLPICAAIGGMAVPAAIYYLLNSGTETADGIGIPMATDIAFSLAVLSLLGNRIPNLLKVFLTALAIIDDLGAIIIIALFYSKGFIWPFFAAAIMVFGIMLILNRARVHNIAIYLLLGTVMWYCMLRSGVHATITGVLLAFAIPFGNGKKDSPSYKLQHDLHHLVAFIILPLFALANTGIKIPGDWLSGLTSPGSLGILAGLVLGKPVGIVLLSMIAVFLGWSSVPQDLRKNMMASVKLLAGAGLLAGIGFTMSIFITLLAYSDEELIVRSKVAVFIASLIAGILGFLMLRIGSKPPHSFSSGDEEDSPQSVHQANEEK